MEHRRLRTMIRVSRVNLERLALHWENFKSGALHVHENYWNLFWYIGGRSLLGVLAFQVVILLPLVFSRKLGLFVLHIVATSFLGVDKMVSLVGYAMSGGIICIAFLPVILGIAPLELVRRIPESSIKTALMNIFSGPRKRFLLRIGQALGWWEKKLEVSSLKHDKSTLLTKAMFSNQLVFVKIAALGRGTHCGGLSATRLGGTQARLEEK